MAQFVLATDPNRGPSAPKPLSELTVQERKARLSEAWFQTLSEPLRSAPWIHRICGMDGNPYSDRVSQSQYRMLEKWGSFSFLF